MFYNARTWVEKLFWVLTFDKTSTLPIVIRISRDCSGILPGKRRQSGEWDRKWQKRNRLDPKKIAPKNEAIEWYLKLYFL